MKVEVWTDVVGPWCYVGRRRFEKALAQFDRRQDVEVTFRSYELGPNAPSESTLAATEFLDTNYPMALIDAPGADERISRLAAEEGLEFHLDRARSTHTLDAHRILQLAGIRGIRPRMEERFQRAYFTEGAFLADPVTLLHLATEAGLSDADVRRVLAGQAFTLQVRIDETEAAALGAAGVPFFVFDRREKISGAQPTEVFLRALGSLGLPD